MKGKRAAPEKRRRNKIELELEQLQQELGLDGVTVVAGVLAVASLWHFLGYEIKVLEHFCVFHRLVDLVQ
jgi:hypothetical protein